MNTNFLGYLDAYRSPAERIAQASAPDLLTRMGGAPTLSQGSSVIRTVRPERKMSAFDWGFDDPLSNEKMGSAIAQGSQALSGILGQKEADQAREYQAASDEDRLAREAYDAKRKAAFRSAALSSLAAV